MTFRDGRRYRDTAGRTWTVKQIIYMGASSTLYLLKSDRPLFPEWRVAADNDDDTATVFLKDGFTTIYDEGDGE